MILETRPWQGVALLPIGATLADRRKSPA